ncbi:MAG: sigma-E factor negative regulatory protein [Pseudomonadales bacterium]|nr:sigma-E factor negative regulatory protein [Pseudomonadales bacterium]MDP6471674.1 sigma-E factor negative regulatory protein [Pseudomonadales bacterium]MDP6970643.1 sigma-E factor negative regulatory protein [Pseudomonadales bacterium]
MSEKLRESLSAVMDGEADEFELRRLLDEMGRDEALRNQWLRFHEARSVLRGEHHAVRANLAERVWEAVTGDATEVPAGQDEQSATEQCVNPKLGRMTGIGVAAAMALAVIVGSSFYQGLPDTPAELAASDPIVGKLEGPVVQLSSEVSADDLLRARAYMMHHVQHKAMNQPGVSSFAKMVAFEERASEVGASGSKASEAE